MRAIHFICGRDDGVSLNHLHFDKQSKSFRSGQWNISEDDAKALVGGWVYLHPTKASKSEFGGRVVGFEPVIDDTLAHSARIVLIVQKRHEGAGQMWRGKDHTMAHKGDLVEANLPHETDVTGIY